MRRPVPGDLSTRGEPNAGDTPLTIPPQVGMEVYTVEISDNLLCLFSARVESKDGSYVIEVPQREIETGSVDSDETYRVALISP